MKPTQLGPFLGENNLLPDAKLATENGDYLRSAINVDLTDAGTLQRRSGTTKAINGTDCHSLWGGDQGAYFIDGASLYQLNDGGASARLLADSLPLGRRMSYTDVPGEVVCSNGLEIYRISGGNLVLAGIEPPRTEPTLTAGTGGGMYAGRYQVAISFIAPDGEESGTPYPGSIDVPANGTLTLSNIEQRAGFETCVYLSTANGTELYRYARTTGTSLAIQTAFQGDGVLCRTALLTRLPAGQIVAYLNGVLFSAVGSILSYSEPYALGLHNPARNYIVFPENITMVQPCYNGIYVSADKTYWIRGDMLAAELVPVLPYKAVFGTSGLTPAENNCFWYSERGIVVGSQEGLVKNLQEATVATSPALAGAAMFREHNGMEQMVASLFGPQQTVMAASSYMDAEVIRKETIL